MKQPRLDDEKFVEKRRKVQTVGGLRREKMIVMRIGERRMRNKNLPDQQDPGTKK